MPRLCSRQRKINAPSNHSIESDDIEGYYRVSVNVFTISGHSDRTVSQKKTKAAGLFSVLCPKTATSLPAAEAESNFSNLWETYSPALHGNNVEPQDTIGLKGQSEFRQWICQWKRTPADDMSNTLLSSLQACDKHVFPTINALLNISVVIPTSTATPERTF